MLRGVLTFLAFISLSTATSAITYQCKDKNGNWTEEACPDFEQRKLQQGQKLIEEAARKNWTPRIGMRASEVEKVLKSPDCYSTKAYKWCGHWRVNSTTNAYGTREQWVFVNSRGVPLYYLYFNDGVLVTIQE